MEDSKKPRKDIALRFFTYGVMTITIVAGVIICAALSMGYRFDIWSGKVSQVALLQFNSYPRGASVYIDGALQAGTTPNRANTSKRSQTIKMTLPNYRTWQKTLSIAPRTVQWLDYVRLIPNNVITKPMQKLGAVADMVGSPDRKWLAVQPASNSWEINILDVADVVKVKQHNIKFDDSIVTRPQPNVAEQFHIIEWDFSSQYLLVRHSWEDKSEYILIDCRNKNDIKVSNIDKATPLAPLSNVRFDGTSGETFYAISNGKLYSVNIKSPSSTIELADNVTSYAIYGNNKLAIVTRTTDQSDPNKVHQTVSLFTDSQLKPVRYYNDAILTQAIVTSYNGQDYLFVARNNTVEIIPRPLDEHHETPTLSHNDSEDEGDKQSTVRPAHAMIGGKTLSWMQLSPNGRMVYAGYDKTVLAYDTETKQIYRFDRQSDSKKLAFLDDYHIFDAVNNNIDILEFDGNNRQTITSGRLPATLSSNNKYIFSLGGDGDNVYLQQSKIVLD